MKISLIRKKCCLWKYFYRRLSGAGAEKVKLFRLRLRPKRALRLRNSAERALKCFPTPPFLLIQHHVTYLSIPLFKKQLTGPRFLADDCLKTAGLRGPQTEVKGGPHRGLQLVRDELLQVHPSRGCLNRKIVL